MLLFTPLIYLFVYFSYIFVCLLINYLLVCTCNYFMYIFIYHLLFSHSFTNYCYKKGTLEKAHHHFVLRTSTYVQGKSFKTQFSSSFCHYSFYPPVFLSFACNIQAARIFNTISHVILTHIHSDRLHNCNRVIFYSKQDGNTYDGNRLNELTK